MQRSQMKFQAKLQKANALRRSLNITEEALAIGKIPPEDVARKIATG